MISYPILFNTNEIDRLTAQSSNLSDDILPLMGKQAQNCLEIGCGVGSNVPIISKYNFGINYFGIDISDIAIQHANSKYGSENVKFQIHEGSQLPFTSNYFDLVVIRLVLWGAANREDILREAYRVLKPNGIIYCFEPDDQFLINYPPKQHLEQLITDWQKKVVSKGCDPFVGRKLHKYLTEVGFEILSNQVKLSTYDSSKPKDFNKALANLGRIFLANGPEFFNLRSDSTEWCSAQIEIESLIQGSVLTEGYFILIAKKIGEKS